MERRPDNGKGEAWPGSSRSGSRRRRTWWAGQEAGDVRILRGLARRVEDILRAVPAAARVRNDWEMERQRIRRREHFRTVGVQAFPATGALASEILNAALPQLRMFGRSLPPGYSLVIDGDHAKGEPLEQALLDAGIARLRPVLVTVGATVFALFPLALHGGRLWQPLCYAQIGGLMIATFITLLPVPVLYAVAVLDLKVVRWETKGE